MDRLGNENELAEQEIFCQWLLEATQDVLYGQRDAMVVDSRGLKIV
jgi:hypothetical protein